MNFENLPLHAAVEMGGAVIALVVAHLLIKLNSTNEGSSFNYSISAAMVAMGSLDGLHAILSPSNSFVWFHSIATFFGGVFFASVWLPKSFNKKLTKNLPKYAVVIAVFIGSLSFFFPSQLPLMITSNGFSYFSKIVNTSGGFLMLMAALKLYITQRKTKRIEDQFFSIQCLIFGVASFLFVSSHMWGFSWWGWHFIRAIAYLLALWLLTKKLEEMVVKFQQLAFYDALTGLANRSLFINRLNIALFQSSRKKQFGAILFIDIDKFKMINDTLGHSLGDMLLKEVANRLKAIVRKVDTVARFGGDEFVIFLENLGDSEENAVLNVNHISEKILKILAEKHYLGDQEYFSSVSIGINLFHGSHKSVEDLINQADMAMYKAKSLGRNRMWFFDAELQMAVEKRLSIETDLHLAITNNHLELYYQIQMNGENIPIGAEGLLRWNHPDRGLVLPDEFISIAEESSLINDLGLWVLDSACRQLKIWQLHEKTRNLEIAINISAVQFKEANFVETVQLHITTHHINPTNLKLELTESVALENLELVVIKMAKLKEIGVGLSLDDFGTGYSSLTYLKKLPFDQIKIDRQFVSHVATDISDAVMVKTIIGLANNLKMSVIAEGVETDQQIAYLKQYGCNLYQGYFFSKPVPIKEFEALIGLNF